MVSSTVMASAPRERVVQGRRQMTEQRIIVRGTIGEHRVFWGGREKSLEVTF